MDDKKSGLCVPWYHRRVYRDESMRYAQLDEMRTASMLRWRAFVWARRGSNPLVALGMSLSLAAALAWSWCTLRKLEHALAALGWRGRKVPIR